MKTTKHISCLLLYLCAVATGRAQSGREARRETELRPAVSRSRNPPVNEAAAERAARSRSKPASISDQIELAIKRGNAARDSVTNSLWIMGGGDGELSEREKRLLAQAESNYQRAAKLNPKDWRAFSALGNLYFDWMRYADAVKAYERAAALLPNDPGLQILLGDVYTSDSKKSDAIRAYSRSIELDPSARNEFAYSRLANAYEEAGLIDEAIQTYKRLQTVKPAKSFYWKIGHLYEKQKRYEQALEAYQSHLRLYPNDPSVSNAYEVMGHIYRRLGRLPEAVDSYRSQLRLSPKRIYTLRALGEAYLEIDEIQAAREIQKDLSVAEREALGSAAGTDSNLLMKHIGLAEQIRQLRQAIRVDPRNADNHLKVGNAYFEWTGLIISSSYFYFDHYGEAIRHYREAIRLEPGMDAAHFNLGLAYLRIGNKSAATDEYQVLRQLNSQYAEELLKAINR